ncbi:hypothetical protein Cgig2_007806 [Carnegiea gigantea]|uniref:RRM domain-containing protein n=1 Tax=Carnegiea gigantea TaxID=171969 RepID=A0A9Q1GQZ7_9CARY|nr:hypothetical protein Cgig2_007806 [Carnegiea gigantea]
MTRFCHSPRVAGGSFQAVVRPPPTAWPSWSAPVASLIATVPTPFQAPIGRHWFMSTRNSNVCPMERFSRVLRRSVPVSKQEPIAVILGDNSKKISIFIDNLPEDLITINFKDLFSSFGEVSDTYIPNIFGRKTSRKYGLSRFIDIQEGTKAIEHMIEWKKGEYFSQSKLVWKWIPKVKNVRSQDISSPYKQAFLSYPNGNKLETQKGANEAVEEDAHEGLSNNGKTINQSLDNAHSRPILLGSSPSKYQWILYGR